MLIPFNILQLYHVELMKISNLNAILENHLTPLCPDKSGWDDKFAVVHCKRKIDSNSEWQWWNWILIII